MSTNNSKNKRWLKFSLIILALFVFWLWPGGKAEAQGTCTITGSFSTSGPQAEDWFKEFKKQVSISVNLTGCDGKKINIQILEAGKDKEYIPKNQIETVSQNVKNIKFDLIAGEQKCNSIPGVLDCNYSFKVLEGETELFNSLSSSTLQYECDGGCNTLWKLLSISADGNTIHEDVNLLEEFRKNQASPDCGLTNLPGCFAWLVDKVVEVTAWLARIAAGFLDFFIAYALDSRSYKSDFINSGWQVTRDIANIVFIFMLLFIAIKTIISGAAAGAKKMITNIVIVALLINFSFFMVKVIVDATNILARVFYNQIEVASTPNDPDNSPVSGTKPVSVALVDKFDPQKLIVGKVVEGTDPDTNISKYIFIRLLAIWVFITMFSVFLGVAIFFLGRVIGIWIAAIFAPFAFISMVLPEKARASLEDWGWNGWFKNLTNMAIMAPIFTFFLYLIILLGDGLKTLISGGLESNKTFTQEIMSIMIPFFIIIALLKKAKELTAKYAGDIGTKLAAAVGKVAGVAAMAVPVVGAVGGAAMIAGGKLGAVTGKGLKKIGLKKIGGGLEGLGKGAAAAPQKIGQFMGETKIGKGLGVVGRMTGTLAGKGLEEAFSGAPEFGDLGKKMKDLGRAGGMLGGGFLTPGKAVAGALGVKPEELGGLGRLGYRDAKERKEDKKRNKILKKKKIQDELNKKDKAAKKQRQEYGEKTLKIVLDAKGVSVIEDGGEIDKAHKNKWREDFKKKKIALGAKPSDLTDDKLDEAYDKYKAKDRKKFEEDRQEFATTTKDGHEAIYKESQGLKEKYRTGAEQKVNNQYGEFRKNFYEEKNREKEEKFNRDFEMSKTKPDYQAKKDIETKEMMEKEIEERIKREVYKGGSLNDFSGDKKIEKENEANELRNGLKTDVGFKNSFSERVDNKLKFDLVEEQWREKINQKVEERIKKEVYKGKDQSEITDPIEKNELAEEARRKRVEFKTGSELTKTIEKVAKDDTDKDETELKTNWATEKNRRVSKEQDTKVKETLGEPPKDFNHKEYLRNKADELRDGNKINEDIADELEKGANELVRLEDQENKQKTGLEKANAAADDIHQRLTSKGQEINQVNIQDEIYGKLSEIEEEIETRKRKLKDPTLTKQEKAKIRKEKFEFEDQKNLYYDLPTKIESLHDRIDQTKKKIKTAKDELTAKKEGEDVELPWLIPKKD